MIRTVDDSRPNKETTMLDHLMPLVSSPWLYAIVFAAVAVDGFIPVVPSEAVVIGLGALSATGTPNVVALAAAATAGGMAGDRVSYLLGRRAGGRLTHGGLANAKAKAERALLRYGGMAILIGRFLPYGRTATAMTSGSVSLPLGRFRLFTALAGAAWAAYAIGLGRLGGATFAHSPLLGAAFGMVLGAILAATHAIVEKRRTAAAKRRFAAGPVTTVAMVAEAPEHELVTVGRA
jgi:membrane-associated protein